MKLLFYTNIPAPYFVAYLNELGKYAEIIAIFEKKSYAHRDRSWKKFNAEHFTYHFLNGFNITKTRVFDLNATKYIRDNPDAIVIIASPLTLVGMQCIEYCRRHKRNYILQSEGGIPKDGKGFKEKLKYYFLHGASLYLSGMKAEGDYFTAYGADPLKIRTYPFASLYEKELVAKLPNEDEKNAIKRELGIRYNKVILFVGRMIQSKGIDVLIRACQGLSKEIGVYMIGGNPAEPFITLAKMLNVNNLHYVTHVPHVTLSKYYLASDVFVLPTRSDTWGLVINESMSYGLPVITTKKCVAGMQLIHDGENGFLIENEDHEALREKIELLLSNDYLRTKMSHNNLKKMKAYTYENMAKVVYLYLREANLSSFVG